MRLATTGRSPAELARRADSFACSTASAWRRNRRQHRDAASAAGIADDGALVLDTPAGPRNIYSGVLSSRAEETRRWPGHASSMSFASDMRRHDKVAIGNPPRLKSSAAFVASAASPRRKSPAGCSATAGHALANNPTTGCAPDTRAPRSASFQSGNLSVSSSPRIRTERCVTIASTVSSV